MKLKESFISGLNKYIMKKILLISLFTLCYNFSSSQVDRRIGRELYQSNSKEKEKTSLTETIDAFFKKNLTLDGFQEAVIHNLAKDYEDKYNQILNTSLLDDFQKKEELEKLNENFKTKVLEILNEDQKKIYLKKITKDKS